MNANDRKKWFTATGAEGAQEKGQFTAETQRKAKQLYRGSTRMGADQRKEVV
jgi:hypothetical protein